MLRYSNMMIIQPGRQALCLCAKGEMSQLRLVCQIERPTAEPTLHYHSTVSFSSAGSPVGTAFNRIYRRGYFGQISALYHYMTA
jgi:hypothetical protein